MIQYITAILVSIMLYNIGYTNTMLIYCHSTVITKIMLLYNTEWQYDHGMAVNYRGKKFYNIWPMCWMIDNAFFATFFMLSWVTVI
jgi:hypothetical protein